MLTPAQAARQPSDSTAKLGMGYCADWLYRQCCAIGQRLGNGHVHVDAA